MQFFFTKFTHKKAKSFDSLVEIPIGYPQRGPSVYFSSFYLRRMEPNNLWQRIIRTYLYRQWVHCLQYKHFCLYCFIRVQSQI